MRSLGFPPIAPLSTAAHLVHFYHHGQGLLDASARFCSAGLRDGECCLWVTTPPWNAEVALYALKAYVASPETCVATGQLQFIPHEDWYRAMQGLHREAIHDRVTVRIEQARNLGWPHVRACGKPFRPLADEDWAERLRYEEILHQAIHDTGLLVLCCYRQAHIPASFREGLRLSHDGVLIAEQDGWHYTPITPRQTPGSP